MLPMYSKSSDQLGPFSGYISPTPRTSIEIGAGSNKAFISVATANAPRVIFETSHTGHPCV